MLRFDHHSHALGFQIVPDRLRHLGGQAFLDLQAPGIAVQHARQFGYPDHPVRRQVGNRGRPRDRGHMVFAMRLERDIFQQHDFIVTAHFLKGSRKVNAWIFIIALAIFAPGAGNALRRILESLAVGIVSSPADQVANRFLNLFGDDDFCLNRIEIEISR